MSYLMLFEYVTIAFTEISTYNLLLRFRQMSCLTLHLRLIVR